MLNPRAIAVQGLGYGPRLVAVAGLWPVETDVTVLPVRRAFTPPKRRVKHKDDVLLLHRWP
jgi:hypothetical protein